MRRAAVSNSPLQSASRWRPRSIALIVLAWLILHIGCLFTPGLLDDVDSIYIEIARSMLLRHDYVTPYIDGIRFFDKPPLMYWLASGSMAVFGQTDWAARLPLALLTLALLVATYALGLRLFAAISPASHPDRAALYSALALATCIGPFLYTRFFIPDILICLWMTLAVHAFLIALDRLHTTSNQQPTTNNSSLIPCLAFAAVTALNLLTKGIIGLVFPIGFVVLYLALTRQLRLLFKLHLIPSTLLFLLIAAPWHILAALRNPAIALPAGLGLPARAGWAWFYLYNEHIARFLQRRIPHDYGQVPVLLFWLLAALWLFPWTAFLPAAILRHVRDLRNGGLFSKQKIVILSAAKNPRISPEAPQKPGAPSMSQSHRDMGGMNREEALTLLGETCVDVYLNGNSHWSAVPILVWNYTLGGYQVLKKWLSYREFTPEPASPLLHRPLHPEEAAYFAQVVRHIAAILLMGPALDASYRAILPTATGLPAAK